MNKLLHSLRNLRKNLRTIKLYVHLHVDWWKWYWVPVVGALLGLLVSSWLCVLVLPTPEGWVDLAPPHDADPYPLNFDSYGVNLRWGPFVLELGLEDSN